jgi:uncharacterized protein
LGERSGGYDAVREATGRGWDEWCDLIDAWKGDKDDHGAVAAFLVEEMHGLRVAVENGTGLAGWHGGVLDAFRNATDFQHIVGGQFVAHPGDFVDHEVVVRPERADHPIVDGLPSTIPLHTEQYWVQHDPACDVLMTTTHQPGPDTPWHEPVTVPVTWTRHWGKGRVFACTIGHSADDLAHPDVREIITRGMLWAARPARANPAHCGVNSCRTPSSHARSFCVSRTAGAALQKKQPGAVGSTRSSPEYSARSPRHPAANARRSRLR